MSEPGSGAAPAEGAVLHFAADWLPASEVFVYDLVRHLRHRSVVVAGNHLQHTDRFPHPDLHSLSDLLRWVRPLSLRRAATTRYLDAVCRRRGVGLVHAHHGYQVERLLGLVARRQLPLVLSLHGHDVTGYLEQRPDAYRQVCGVVDAVVVPSRFLAGLAEAAGFDPSLIRILPSGVDTARFTPSPLPEGPPTVLFVGRFVAKKGLDVLAAAWPSVQAAVPEARLRLLGSGPLESLARSIAGRVSVVSSPDSEAVRRAMRAARLVVSPSHQAADDAFESLLMVNLEAQASGRPVVTTRHGGIPEFVDEGVSALVVPERDPRSLAQAIIELLRDEARAAGMGRAGPGTVAGLDVRLTAARMDDLYDQLCGPLNRRGTGSEAIPAPGGTT